MRLSHTLSLAAWALLAPALVFADGPSTRVSHVWIREAPPGTSVLGGYFTLENLTDRALTLTGVSSPDFGSVEIHQNIQKDGIESMQKLDSLSLPARGSIELRPGSYHLMLMQPRKNLFSGDSVSLTLEFSDGSELAILAHVRHDPPLH